MCADGNTASTVAPLDSAMADNSPRVGTKALDLRTIAASRIAASSIALVVTPDPAMSPTPDSRSIMKRAFPPASIVVGVDGSKASVEAAVWAVDEAVDRDIPLRLVNVMTRHSEVKQHSRGLDRDYAHAERITHQAWSAVEATGKPVKLTSRD